MNGNAILAWISVAGFTFASAWPLFSDQPLPFLGLRGFSSPVFAWPLVLLTASLAVFLSLPRLHTRARLVACIFISFGLFMAIAFLASPVAPMLLAFISGNLFRETRLPPQAQH
ncbi:MAG TPA: hypothetical protein VFK84_10395 [Burkholderiales bacterium]|nr:hypothetical protein [Burkholderiales bacterium]